MRLSRVGLSVAVTGIALALMASNAGPVRSMELLITDVSPSDNLLFAGPESGTLESGATHVLPVITASPNPFPDPFDEKSGEPAGGMGASPAQEEAFIETLGVGPVSFAGKTEGLNSATFSETTAFDWVFAFVKADGFWLLYENLQGDRTFTGDQVSHDYSHVTYFVPLPAAAWLMLTALAGLVGWRRWFGRSEPAVA